MATTFAAPSTGEGFRPFGRSKIQHFPEAASQSFKRGYPVILSGAGVENRLTVASDNPTAAIVGIAAADATGTTGAMCPVWLAKPEFQFQGRTFNTDAVDFSDIGTCRAIQAHASVAVWVVDTSDAGNDSVVVEHYRNPITNAVQTTEGDFDVTVIFHFDPKATIFGAGV